MFDVFETQAALVAAALPSGFEQRVGQWIAEQIKPYADEIRFDKLGNLIAHKEGSGKKVMVSAHMDTIGFMATYIDEQGFVRFDTIGGISPANLMCIPVVFANGTRGVTAWQQEERRGDKPQMSEMYIDIGACSKEEAEQLVKIGDVATYANPAQRLAGGKMASPYCDNLISCVAAMRAMEQLKACPNDVYFVFSTQEEVGLRGAGTASYHIAPDYGIAIDGTHCGDYPARPNRSVVELGKGPCIKYKDSSVLCNPQVVAILEKAAERSGIACQREVLLNGGTDTAAIQKSRGGVPAGCISIPMRYIHTPSETVCIRDVEQAADLLCAALEQAL